MKAWLMLLGALFALLEAPAAQAQVTVDLAKITCEQYLLDQITDRKTISLWVSGYFNGTRNNTIIDTSTMKKDADEVEKYCLSHGEMNLMDAVKNALGGKK
jgi:hypothetical protein